jgi:hypothetical protein
MQLIEIEKSTYRKNLNIVIVIFVASLFILSLSVSSLFIALWGDSLLVDGKSTNFSYNLSGVIFAVLVSCGVLYRLKNYFFFTEIYYVWQLKQINNLIYRKIKKIKAAATNDDINALIILNFYHQSRKQVYLLDDNIITLSSLEQEINRLDEQLKQLNLTVTIEQFDKTLLSDF